MMAVPIPTRLSRCAQLLIPILLLLSYQGTGGRAASRFHLEEATIEDVHSAMKSKELTATQLVNLYLKRIEAYNGRCVQGAVDPATGFQLGDITAIENAGQINALMTLNLRGKRSKTDSVDNDPGMPDALEVARALDAAFAKTGKLVGPLHGIPFAIKDQFETRDMRSTAGAAANYANDRPPHDAEVVARLRAAGAIILAKGNMGEYATGDRSTYGGTTCNPYDTSRSAGRSSGGPGAAVAANLILCAIGEESGPSARNPASNNSLVGIVATRSLVSRKGMIPSAILSSPDRPGVLCRTVKDAATVLGVIGGYDPKDPGTAASVGQMPREPYASFALKPSLKGLRIGVIREFMQPFTKADEDSIRIANEAIADLTRLGAVVVDPGPDGQLFKDAIAELVPSLDSARLVSTFKEIFGDGDQIETLLAISSGRQAMPPAATLRWFYDAPGGGGASASSRYVMDRYLQERGDKVIKDVQSLVANSVFFRQPPIEGFRDEPRARLEATASLVRKETWKKQEDGTPFIREIPMVHLDVADTLAHQAVLQALVLKVMADYTLDALVYPTKTIPAPVLASPLEPQNIKSVSEISTVTMEGVKYIRTTERVLDQRDPLAWRLSAASGLPAIVVPAGFTREIYDRAVVIGEDGARKAGELVGPKALALPVSIDFLGRPFSEPVLIRIAAAFEDATHHRHPPKNFGSLPGEP